MSNEQSVSPYIKKILDAFDFLEGPLPRQAILEAREHRNEIIPELLKAFQAEIDIPEGQRKFQSWFSTIALYLLVEFRAKEALPIVLKSLHYPEDAIDAIYGDSLTEDMPGILYYLGVEPDTLESLVRNEKLYLYVRWEALHCFYYFVRDGRMTIEELIDRFQIYLKETVELNDPDMPTALISELVSCGAESALPLIEQACEKDLVDTFFVGTLEDIQEDFRVFKPSFEKIFGRLEDYADALTTLDQWHSFQPNEDKPEKRALASNESKPVGLKPLQNNMSDEAREFLEQLTRPKSREPLPKLHVPPPLPVDSAKLYTMKVTLLDIEPPIWRRFVVPSFMKLNHLHELLQVFMGWDNAHLYAFIINGKRFSTNIRSFAVDAMWDKEPSYEAVNYELCQLIKPSMTFHYKYDFGDGWEHEITVENVTASKDTKYSFYCIEGERACPPEDCGGPGGYKHLLEVLSDPNDPEYKERLGWLGGSFDSEKFNPDACNRVLKVRVPAQLADSKIDQAALRKKKKQERKRKDAAKKRNRK